MPVVSSSFVQNHNIVLSAETEPEERLYGIYLATDLALLAEYLQKGSGIFYLVFGLLFPVKVRTAAVLRSLKLLLYLGGVFQSLRRNCQQCHRLRPGLLF